MWRWSGRKPNGMLGGRNAGLQVIGTHTDTSSSLMGVWGSCFTSLPPSTRDHRAVLKCPVSAHTNMLSCHEGERLGGKNLALRGNHFNNWMEAGEARRRRRSRKMGLDPAFSLHLQASWLTGPRGQAFV